MCVVVFVVFYIVKAPLPGAFSHALYKRLKCVNRNELSMFKALNKSFKPKCAVLLLNQVEGRLKSLKKLTLNFILTDTNSTFVFEGIQSCAKNVISH